ncbi:AfsR/SARP family transcriptional regulator [Streptomyces aureocirculatus]|uniref:AfsR/SARP family transcriptional regulator n=1 Tax=Streptomyces aureocirculatus TaxID=67275 RepID=UPI000565F17A|nr:BTAD domain-containing putative transcriptional regulator [Streptomyces aureocirculatus]
MRYQILGATQAHDDEGAPLPVGGPRLRALLAALALHPNRTVPVPTLIDDIWAESPPTDAPAALQALVGRLRRALGSHAIASAPGGYRLTATPDEVDLHRFERLTREGIAALDRDDPATAARVLREALSLWHGPALADLPDRTAATRPEARRQEATRARVTADLLLGHGTDVLPELKELVADHPYDEALRAQLIRALRDAGRGADALAAYEDARRTLAEGLGTDPGKDLRALHAELLAAPTAPTAPTAATAATAAAGTAATGDTAGTPAPQPPTDRKGNLRPRLTSFVGREPELAAIRSDMCGARLVTLTGPGGSGKTRLAEEAAAGHPSAWLAELAPLDRPEAVPGAVVSALGLREVVLRTSELTAPQGDPVAQLVEYCAQRSLLLILDNCEHVIGAAAELVETLLTRCPGLTVLATSREPLGVPGERVRPVEPLPPDPAHRLFAERAAAVRPGFDPVGQAEAVAEICRRLDGLPLAIELAAARLRLLTPRQIADRLDDRFRLLTSGARTVLPRQQTLRAVVDWSWDLLDDAERTVLREVSVFAGGWDLEAAEAVCSGPAADLIGALVDKSLVIATPYDPAYPDPSYRDASYRDATGLGDRDLGVGDLGAGDFGVTDAGGPGPGVARPAVMDTGHAPPPQPATGMRYRLLETIHEYAVERAAEAPALRAGAERRHAAYFLALAETAEPLLRSGEQLPWIQRLETELDNLRAVLQRALESRDEDLALALTLALGWFWWLRNYRVEGSEWAERVLALTVPPEATGAGRDVSDGESGAGPSSTSPFAAGAAGLDADLDAYRADEDAPRFWPRMSLRLLHVFLTMESRPAEVLGSEPDKVYILRVRDVFTRPVPASGRFPGLVWPFTLYFVEEANEVLAYLDRATANCRRFGGDWEVAITLMFRVHTAVDQQGNLFEVDRDLAELRELSRRVGDRWLRAQVCGAAGEAAMARSLHEEARLQYEEALRLAYEVGAYAEGPFLIARLAEIAYRAGDRDLAEKGLEAAAAAADRYGVLESRAFICLMSADMALRDGDVERARALCDAARDEAGRGTPPPQFAAGLGAVRARITAAESGPGAGLAVLVDVLPQALRGRCSEAVVATLVDAAAVLMSRSGDHARATRLLAFATHWLGDLARPMPERADVERTVREIGAALGESAYERESAAGRALTMEQVLDELTTAARRTAPGGPTRN